MGQINVEKNVGGIEGLCVITPQSTVTIADTLWKLTMKTT